MGLISVMQGLQKKELYQLIALYQLKFVNRCWKAIQQNAELLWITTKSRIRGKLFERMLFTKNSNNILKGKIYAIHR